MLLYSCSTVQLTVAVYFLLMCSSSDGQFCSTSSVKSVTPKFDVCKHNAYCRKSEKNRNSTGSLSDCNYSCVSHPELKITNTVVNSSLGVMKVIFTPFTLCNFNEYEITLLANEKITRDACSSTKDENVYQMHSSKSVSTVTCEVDSTSISGKTCDENVTLEFNHIFTGCYMFIIQPKINFSTRKPILTSPQYFVTDYEKKLITGLQPKFSLHYIKNSNNGDGDLDCSIVYDVSECQLVLLTLSKISSGVAAYKRIFVARFNTSDLSDERKLECDVNGLNITAHCKYLNGGALSCIFRNVSSGHYHAKIQFIDERCDPLTLWVDVETAPCAWYHEYWVNATDISSNPVHDNVLAEVTSVKTTLYIIVPIVITFSIVLLRLVASQVLVNWYRKLRSRYHEIIPSDKEFLTLLVKEHPPVLLLYARDCDVFMNVMKEFRMILISLLKCQVYDCWDHAQHEKVAENYTDWVLGLIADKNVRIILVSTPCYRLLEKSCLTDIKFQYREPCSFDNLIVLALKQLTDTTIMDSYKRIFVVSVDRNTQDNNSSLRYLNPLAVYLLPTHLVKLMLGLHRVDNMEYGGSLLDLPRIKHFSSLIELFQNFEHNNPDYLDSLLEKADPYVIR